MKKSIIFGMSILSVFILCSLSYQPIIADTPIENIPIIKKSKVSNLDINELKELYNKLIEIKSQSNDDCGCDKDNSEFIDWDFPIICTILGAIAIIGIFLFMTIGITIIGEIAFFLGNVFNCPWT